MKKILVLLVLTLSLNADAQTGLLLKRYYITGSLSVGKDGRGFADSSAWLQVGTDTTDRGIMFPKVVLDSVNTAGRALFVYDLRDSVLYHFDGTARVRYMTYRDTALVKQLISTGLAAYVQKTDTARSKFIATYSYTDSLAGTRARYSDTASIITTRSFLLNNYFARDGNSFGTGAGIGTKDNFHLDLLTNNTSKLRIFNNGNVSIASVTDAGYKLSVTGTARITDETYIEKKLHFQNNTQGIHILDANTAGLTTSIIIGRGNNGNPTTGNRHIKIGNDNTTNLAKSLQYIVGSANTVSSSNSGVVVIGEFNNMISADDEQYIIGQSNTMNFTNSQVSRGQSIIGSNNSITHQYCSIFGNNQQTTAANQLIFADANPNTGSGGYREVFFGTGPKSNLSSGLGAPVTINSSGGNGTNKEGGLMRIAAGRGTGNATPADIIFATTTAGASGITGQSLADRWYIKGNTGYLSNNSAPGSLLDLAGLNGYSQLRLRVSYTPSSSADSNGNTGDIAWDSDYLYIKTAGGWKRAALSAF